MYQSNLSIKERSTQHRFRRNDVPNSRKDAMFRTAVYFLQSCPICGRRQRIDIHELGNSVICGHCYGTFVAFEENSCFACSPRYRDPLLEQADRLLEISETLEKERLNKTTT